MKLAPMTLVTPALLNRRAALGALGALTVAGCGGGSTDTATATSGTGNADASLSALSLSAGSVSPAFSSATTNYAVAADNSVTTTTVTASATATGSSISVHGSTVTSGSTSAAITLMVDSNALSIVITAADGTTMRTYTVTVTRAAATAGNCTLIPEETQGPFPLLAILSNSAVVRTDIRESETGMPLRLDVTLLNTNNAFVPITNAAVYIWHCNSAGEYSGYSGSGNGNHVGETFLRGVQLTDAAGQACFTTLYPGW